MQDRDQAWYGHGPNSRRWRVTVKKKLEETGSDVMDYSRTILKMLPLPLDT